LPKWFESLGKNTVFICYSVVVAGISGAEGYKDISRVLGDIRPEKLSLAVGYPDRVAVFHGAVSVDAVCSGVAVVLEIGRCSRGATCPIIRVKVLVGRVWRIQHSLTLPRS
jgi:hypothetical protein